MAKRICNVSDGTRRSSKNGEASALPKPVAKSTDCERRNKSDAAVKFAKRQNIQCKFLSPRATNLADGERQSV